MRYETFRFLIGIVPIPSKLHKYNIACADAYDSKPWSLYYNIIYVRRNLYNVHNIRLTNSTCSTVARGPCPYRYNSRVLNNITSHIIIVCLSPVAVPRLSSICSCVLVLQSPTRHASSQCLRSRSRGRDNN